MMKKNISLILVGIIIFSSITVLTKAEQNPEVKITEKIIFSNPVINSKADFEEIILKESKSLINGEGKPVLPAVVKVFTFPFGTKIDKVSVSFSDEKELVISKPVKPTSKIHDLPVLNQEKVDIDYVIDYSDIDQYPENKYSYRTGAGIKDGKHVLYLSLSLNPISYRPAENLLLYHNSADIEINYRLSEKIFSSQDSYDLLILTPGQFKTALQILVNHKNDIGMKTKMVGLEDIPNLGGFDKQEDIKLFIKQSIENWGINYVLLVGADSDRKELFPARFAELPTFLYEERFPCLLYYADIYKTNGCFSSWDDDGDHRYGEFEDDLSEMDMYPDVYLGYLPCNNAIEVATIVSKIIDYKAHNKMVYKVLLAGGDTWLKDPEGIYEGELLNTKVLEELPGYDETRLWASKNTLTKSNIASNFRKCVDFVDFSGHGDHFSWGTHPHKEMAWLPEKTIKSPADCLLNADFDIYSFNNAYKLPVVVYGACWTNKFTDSSDCLGWKTLSISKGGGIASFGSTGVSFTYEGEDVPNSIWGWLEIELFDELFSNKILGEVWSNTITNYLNTFVEGWDITDTKTIASLAIFGDPTLVVEDGDDPRARSSRFLPIETFLEKYPILYNLLQRIIKK